MGKFPDLERLSLINPIQEMEKMLVMQFFLVYSNKHSKLQLLHGSNSWSIILYQSVCPIFSNVQHNSCADLPHGKGNDSTFWIYVGHLVLSWLCGLRCEASTKLICLSYTVCEWYGRLSQHFIAGRLPNSKLSLTAERLPNSKRALGG